MPAEWSEVRIDSTPSSYAPFPDDVCEPVVTVSDYDRHAKICLGSFCLRDVRGGSGTPARRWESLSRLGRAAFSPSRPFPATTLRTLLNNNDQHQAVSLPPLSPSSCVLLQSRRIPFLYDFDTSFATLNLAPVPLASSLQHSARAQQCRPFTPRNHAFSSLKTPLISLLHHGTDRAKPETSRIRRRLQPPAPATQEVAVHSAKKHRRRPSAQPA